MSRTYSVFFPSDSDMYDVMYCNERKININFLHALLLNRGILISKADSREDLITFASSLNFNYMQFKDISKQVAKASRNEKLSVVEIECSDSELDLSEITDAFMKQYGSKPQEKYSKISSNIQESVRIDIEYDEIDHSKTRLIQKMKKEACIEIDKSETGVRVRYTANEKINSRVDSLIRIIGEKLEIPQIKRHEIDFSEITNKLKITTFFRTLVNETDGFKLQDVSSIRFHRPKNDEITIFENETDEITSSENEADEISSRIIQDETDGLILKASFVGGSLLTSKECQEFLQKGYYISKIRWIGESLDSEHSRVVMEAELNDPIECKGYKFHILGQHNPKDKNFEDYTETLRVIALSTRKEIEKKLESSSYRIYNSILIQSEELK